MESSKEETRGTMWENAEYLQPKVVSATSQCKHSFYQDTPNHYLCGKCGYGKYGSPALLDTQDVGSQA